MDWHGRIVIDPEVLAGKPIIKGTRLSVEFVVGLLAAGWSESQVIESYPTVTRADILACLGYASEALKSERIYPLAV